MNTLEVDSARQELLRICKNMPTDFSYEGTYKEAIVNDEYSVLLYVTPTTRTSCTVAVFKNSGSGRGMIIHKRLIGDNPKQLSTGLVNEVTGELEDICVRKHK